MKADAALCGAACVVVLHTKAMEDARAAVVHAHGHGHMQLALRPAQHLVRGIIQIEDGSGFVQLLLGERKRVQVFSHVGASAGRAGKQAPPWVSFILMQVGSKHRQSADNSLYNRLIPPYSMVWRAYRVRDSVLRKW